MARAGARASPRGRGRRASPARRCAFRVLRRVSSEGAFADRAFHGEAARAELSARDRAFAQRLAYGTIQRRATLDHLAAALATRAPETIDPSLLDVLRLGLYQLLYMEAVPDHAAVSESVELAREAAERGTSLANAVLRRATREGRALLAELSDATPEGAAVLHSHPEWIARSWWELLGREETIALLERDNAPAESAVRANTLRIDPAAVRELLAALGVDSRAAPWPAEALVLETPFDVLGSDAFAQGLLTPQSRGSMLVGQVLAPRPGERVLDLCAAPGAKTTHLAALMERRGTLVAVERHPGRVTALRRNCERMGVPWVDVREADASVDPAGDEYDRVLLDAPCSDLGTLQSRPDARWRKSEEQVGELAAEQRRLLDAAAERVRPGGTLVYSTCTISPPENEMQIRRLLKGRLDFDADDLSSEHPQLAHPRDRRFLQLLPHRDWTDGFFIARLRRSGGTR
jgi:16S rRNA (cytosine967-C5)-methyltransferase